jgi:hypothetical protein
LFLDCSYTANIASLQEKAKYNITLVFVKVVSALLFLCKQRPDSSVSNTSKALPLDFSFQSLKKRNSFCDFFIKHRGIQKKFQRCKIRQIISWLDSKTTTEKPNFAAYVF